jgi:hypothetical protein
METTMIDTILTLPLELMALTLLVGSGILYSYHSRRSTTTAAPVARPFDMRVDGQQLSV